MIEVQEALDLIDRFTSRSKSVRRSVDAGLNGLILAEDVFSSFCRLILESDAESGANCEIVQDFLKERGQSKVVSEMVGEKLHAIRGSEGLIAGLCHPSKVMRNHLIKRMLVTIM